MNYFLAERILLFAFICCQPFQALGTGRYGGGAPATTPSTPAPPSKPTVKPAVHPTTSPAAKGNQTDLTKVISIIKKIREEKAKLDPKSKSKATKVSHIETKSA